MKRLFHSAVFISFIAIPAEATVDENTNGLSDLWEKIHNDGMLFPASFDPNADPDGDGWTNLEESIGGTNPFDANPPGGFLIPAIERIPGNPASTPPTPQQHRLTWSTLAGKTYQVFCSTTLLPDSWVPGSDLFLGSGVDLTYDADALLTDGSTPPAIFWRVGVADTNSDSDDFSDWEEGVLGTNANSSDTDGDGIDDSDEPDYGTDPNLADSDGDSIPDGVEIASGHSPIDNQSFPPRFVSVIRYGEYTPLAEASEGWNPRKELSGPDNTEDNDYDGYAEVLELFDELPFPDEIPNSPKSEDGWTVRNALASVHYADYSAGQSPPLYGRTIQKRVWMETKPANHKGYKVEALAYNVESLSNDQTETNTELSQNVQLESFEIPTGSTISDPVDLIPSIENFPTSLEPTFSYLSSVTLLPVELRDVNGAGDADDVTITPWDTSQDIANNNIAWIDAHQSAQNAAPRMPQLEFRVPGLPEGLTIEAKLFVEYERPYAGKQGEDTVKIPANGNFTQVNGDTWQLYNEADWQTELNERGFFGGDAKLTYQIKQGENVVVGPEEIDFAIGGENPADDRCKQYTQSRPGAPWYAYAIEKHESQAYNPGFYNQFWERSGNNSPINGGINYEFTLGDPLKVLSPGENGVGGTGLAQVTGAGGNKNNPAAREIFWNWQRNVDAFLTIMAGKIQIAETFMNDQTPRNGPGSMPNGQRPQTSFHTGQNVPVPSRDQASVTFGDNQGERRPEDAVAIKAYNGASAHWCSWRGPAVHEWQWNDGQNNYVERVCEQVEEEEE